MEKVKRGSVIARQKQDTSVGLVWPPGKAWTRQHLAWLTFGLVMLSFFIFFMVGLFMPGRTNPATASGGAVVAVQYVCEGKITRFEDGVAELEATSGERFVLNPVAEGFRAPEVGSLQRVALVPFRRSADNIFLARIRTMRKISQYSQEVGGGS